MTALSRWWNSRLARRRWIAETLITAVLVDAEQSGYQLMRRTGLSGGRLYTALVRLEESGLVSSLSRSPYANGNAVYLIVTRGLPGSGKTSWAIGTGWPRVNRDLLRDELHGVRDYTPEHEEHVTEVQRERVNTLLASGQTVVADDTNLPDRRIAEWQAIAGRHGATLVVADQFLRTSVDECIRRQAGRPVRERVPATEIRRMWLGYIAEHPEAVA